MNEPTVVTRGPTRRSHTESGRNWPVSGVSLIHPLSFGCVNLPGTGLFGSTGARVPVAGREGRTVFFDWPRDGAARAPMRRIDRATRRNAAARFMRVLGQAG